MFVKLKSENLKDDIFMSHCCTPLCLCNTATCSVQCVRPHPERAVVGGAEHFGLVGGGDDGKSIHRSHVTRQGPHLLLRLDIPHLERRQEDRHHQNADVTAVRLCPRRTVSLEDHWK